MLLPAPGTSQRALLALLSALLLFSLPAFTQEKKPRDLKHHNLGKDGLAIAGYDPVAYFPEGGGKAKKGSDKITTRHEGVLYRFASEANRKLFLAKPARFEPEYGGWCAYAMARGKKVEVNPKSFLVTDGKLLLFYKSFLNDTRAKWLEKAAALKLQADAAWKKLVEAPEPED